MSQLEKDVVNEELSRSIGELSRRKKEANTIISEIIAVIGRERSTLLYADDEYKRNLLKTVFEEFSIK